MSSTLGKKEEEEKAAPATDPETDEAPKVFEISAVEAEDAERGQEDVDEDVSKAIGEDQKAPKETKNGDTCGLALNIASIVCLSLMSIFFICGSAFTHPDNLMNNLDEPLAFLLVGAMCYIAVATIDIFHRKSKGVLEIIAGCIGLVGGVFWFIASIFLFSSVDDGKAWAGLWLFGSLCILFVVSYDLVILFRSQTKSLFRAIALGLAWLANILFIGGAGNFLGLVARVEKAQNAPYGSVEISKCDLANPASVLISASAMYLFHTIFCALAIFYDNVIFSVEVSRSAPVPSDQMSGT